MDTRSIAEIAVRLCTGLTKVARQELQHFTPAREAMLLKKHLQVGGWERRSGKGFMAHFGGAGKRGR